MIVRLVSIDEFYQHFPDPVTVYSSKDFIRLNQGKADAVRFFVGFDEHGKSRLGLVIGFKGGEWRAPFSAPFVDFAFRKPESIELIYDFISELTDMLQGAPIRITLSPPLYQTEMWHRVVGVLANYASKTMWDYSYHYPLDEVDNYRERMASEPRRKFKQAQAQGFEFKRTDDGDTAYNLIAEHHRTKGYPMAMTREQVMATSQVVPSDLFLLSLNGENIAAAYCQHVAAPHGQLVATANSQNVGNGGAQLIYWGDKREYSQRRPMNWLAYELCQYYASRGFSTLDFGPSSTNGIPNPSLCDFKQSIGCTLSLKPTFLINPF